MRDSINYRRHRNACPHYRERWVVNEAALYQIICLKDTPPLTAAEQRLCFNSRAACWRKSKQGGCPAETDEGSAP